MTRGAIVHMLKMGRLHREHAGVYAVGHLAEIPLGRETAALLSCHGDAVLSHSTAAAIWKLRPRSAGPVELTVADASRGQRAGVVVHRTRRLKPDEVRILDGLPITSPARTIFDIAPRLADRELERVLDEATVQRLVLPGEITEGVERGRGRAGTARIRALLDKYSGTTISDSEAEDRFLMLIRAAGLPEPNVNLWIHGCKPDFYWPEYGIVVEVDGYRYHSSRSKFERDRAKGAKLAAAGLNVIRVTWLQMEREPFAVVANTSQAIAWAQTRRAS